MEVNRIGLHGILENAMLSAGEEPHLYYQPPENVKLVYPCVIYQLASFTSRYADNLPYHQYVHFDVPWIFSGGIFIEGFLLGYCLLRAMILFRVEFCLPLLSGTRLFS